MRAAQAVPEPRARGRVSFMRCIRCENHLADGGHGHFSRGEFVRHAHEVLVSSALIGRATPVGWGRSGRGRLLRLARV